MMSTPVFFQLSIKAARANANMTLAQWANAMGVSIGTASGWENGQGEPNASQLRKMSELSRVPMDYIFVRIESDENESE